MIHQPETIKKDLLNLAPSVFATKWFFDTIPYVFESHYDDYVTWRHSLAQNLEIDPSDIIITGSANLGVSLNPYKNFKAFNEQSDIDICIFSEHYFSIAWHDLCNTSLKGLSTKMSQAVKSHTQSYIYWGTVATDYILPILSFGKTWARIIPQLSEYPMLQDHEINFRIYKDRLSFRRYLIRSIEERRNTLLGAD